MMMKKGGSAFLCDSVIIPSSKKEHDYDPLKV